MKSYVNEFIFGRDLLKKVMIATVVSCVLSVIFRANIMLQGIFAGATLILFISAIVIDCKYCRCPHCGKVIFLGVLAVTACPKCKRNLVSGKKVKKSR